MDGQTKLIRKQSSLLRSSPTIRSSIQSLSSVTDFDEEDQKPHPPPQQQQQQQSPTDSSSSSSTASSRWNRTPFLPFSTSSYTSPYSITKLIPFLAVASASLFASFAYLRTEEISTSENLLLVLIFVAVGLFFAGKNRQSIEKSFEILKHFYTDNSKKLRFGHKNRSKSVQWYIGGSDDYHLSSSSAASRSKRERFSSSLSFPATTSAVTAALAKQREGVEFYSNGDFYEGEFYKGKSNGSGVYNYFVNGRYEGDWVDGRYDGYGIESWARGSRYRGQYRHGLRHGYGIYRFYTGDSYTGEWSNGQYHGVGIQTCSDGSCYIGEFKCGAKHGVGCYHFRNGDRYGGEYFGDKIHGFGVYHFANGHCFEGSWHEGKRQGYGVYTFSRKGESSKCGEWDSGSLKTPLPPLAEPILRAVQSARKAAEKAVHLRQVDDQVNKAVLAANRAATAARVAAVKAVQSRMEGKSYSDFPDR